MTNHRHERSMSRSHLPIIALLIGMALFVCSWLWPFFVGGRHAWSDSDAAQYQQAAAQLHELTYLYGVAVQQATQGEQAKAGNQSVSPDPIPTLDTAGVRYAEVKSLADRLAQVKERYNGLHAKLTSAQTAGWAAAGVMRWVGIVVIAIGALGYFSMRSGGNR
jgi:hypothetical protein